LYRLGLKLTCIDQKKAYLWNFLVVQVVPECCRTESKEA